MYVYCICIAECPSGMIYQQCASLRPQMCGNARATTSPPGGCAAGCFCPDGQFLRNGICIDPIACPGLCEPRSNFSVKCAVQYVEIHTYYAHAFNKAKDKSCYTYVVT